MFTVLVWDMTIQYLSRMDYTGSSYKGDMKNDKMEGEGEYAFPSGTKYIGSFKDGTFEGKGTLHFKNGNNL